MRVRRFRLEFWVTLHGHEPRVRRQFDHFHERAIGAGAGNPHPVRFELCAVIVVDFKPVAVAFGHDRRLIRRMGFRARFEATIERTEPHRPADLRDFFLGIEQCHDGVRRVFIELGRIRAGKPEDVTCELDRGTLQAEADAEERDVVLANEANRFDFTVGAPLVEATGNEQAIDARQHRGPFLFDFLGLDPLEPHFAIVENPGMIQGFVNRLVRIAVFDVFADERDRDLVGRLDDASEHLLPVGHVDLSRRRQLQFLDDQLVEFIRVQAQRHFVDTVFAIFFFDDSATFEATHLSDFIAILRRNRSLGTTDNHIGLDADLAEFLHAVLRRFRFQFARCFQIRHERQVDEQAVRAARFERELTNRLEERHPFDVADGAADFGNHHVDIGRDEFANATLNFIGDVRNDLHRFAAILAATFFGDDRLIDFPGREVAIAVEVRIRKSFVVSQVEIGFCAVVEDVDFAVLIGAHRPRIDVEIRVEFLQADFETAAFEEHADRCRRQPLPE